MNNTPSDNQKAWVVHLRNLIGGDISVHVYYDESEEHSIPIFTSTNDEGTVCATLGLMEIDQSHNPDVQIHSEIILDKRGNYEGVANVLSTLAFYIIKNGWRVAPGVVFKDIMKTYFPETNLPHLYFTTSFQWPAMSKVELPEGKIYPLVAIPISESEDKMASEKNGQALEDMWAKENVDVLNWNRESVV
jgi:hypothetical protein